MTRFLHCILMCLLGGAASAQDCVWLPAAMLDRAIPELAPWHAYSVGQARCDFASERAVPRHFATVERVLHDSPEAARAAVRGMKGALSSLFTAEPVPTLGSAAFLGVTPIAGGELLSLTGHRDRLYVQLKLGFPSGITAAHREAGLGLAGQALGTSGQMAATEDLPQCPHLDVALLAQRMVAVRVSLPRDGTCVIRAGTQVLHVERERQTQAEDLIQYLIEDACNTQPLPALGAAARLVWGCGEGTRLLHAEGDWLLSYDYRSGAASTPEDRAWLAAVAQQRSPDREDRSPHRPGPDGRGSAYDSAMDTIETP